jgi:hypothetical protein
LIQEQKKADLGLFSLFNQVLIEEENSLGLYFDFGKKA